MRTTRSPETPATLCLLSTVALLALGGNAFAQAGAPATDEEAAPPAATAAPAAAAPAAAPAAVAAPPAAEEQQPAAPGAPKRKRSGAAAQIGLSPQDTMISGPSGPPSAVEAAPAEDWGFKFHGYFRGPMRLSMTSLSGKGVQFHAPPVTPDLNYTTWSYTNNNPGPWGELLFQYGNNRAVMTAAIASYNITSGGWRELQDQLGIDRAFLTLNFPDALGDLGKLTWNVGVFSNRYGAMGKYDAGAYETYMIGRTRVAGETLTGELDVADDIKIVVEHGIGAKMDAPQWATYPYTSWMPYPSYAQMGTTLLHHLHVGAVVNNMFTLTGHYMYTWTKDTMRTGMNGAGSDVTPDKSSTWANSKVNNAKDGSMQILGVDLKMDGGYLGDGYIGFSSIKCKNAGVLMDTIEVLHSQGGWQFTNNFLGDRGNGTVNSIGFQYTFSLAAFMLRPQAWWGQGSDLTLQVFGMYNLISGVDNSGIVSNAGQVSGADGYGTKKFKAGGQLLYTPLPFISIGTRFDMVQPNLDNSNHNFMVFSPKLVFRTDFVTHEMVILQYQYYSYGSWYNYNGNFTQQKASMPYPYGGGGPLFFPGNPDKHTFTIAASMWW
jgi:hypothetical protein